MGSNPERLLGSQFDRIPWELLKDILTRLDAQRLRVAAGVCKAWREIILAPKMVRSLYSPRPLVLSNAFLLELECYETRDGIKPKQVRVAVDVRGRCHLHDIANTPQFDVGTRGIKAVTDNGLIAFAENPREAYVINPAVKVRKKIQLGTAFCRNQHGLVVFRTPYLTSEIQFTGMHFDPAICNFMYLVGCSASAVHHINGGRGVVWVYNSRFNTWTDLTQIANFGSIEIPSCVGVYSSGCFFWYKNDTGFEKKVVCFNVRERHFFHIELPQLHDEEEGKSRMKKWALKGCDGWIVLLLNVDGRFTKCWRLVKDEYGYGWGQQTTDLEMLGSLLVDSYNVGRKHDLYNINAQGWWCVANCVPEEESDSDDYRLFTIYDERGKFQHCIEKRQLISELGIHEKCVRVRVVWPFQINNICWPRW